MGRRKKGSNRMGGSKLENAVSDEEGEGPGEDGIYDEVDLWDMEQDKVLMAATKRTGGRQKQENMEMFALSGIYNFNNLI